MHLGVARLNGCEMKDCKCKTFMGSDMNSRCVMCTHNGFKHLPKFGKLRFGGHFIKDDPILLLCSSQNKNQNNFSIKDLFNYYIYFNYIHLSKDKVAEISQALNFILENYIDSTNSSASKEAASDKLGIFFLQNIWPLLNINFSDNNFKFGKQIYEELAVYISNPDQFLGWMIEPQYMKSVLRYRAWFTRDFFLIVLNHRSSNWWPFLCEVKELVAERLPMMPKSYIMRPIFDGKHHIIGIVNNDKLLGAAVFRPFVKENFVELVFFVVAGTAAGQGWGTQLMNSLKSYIHKPLSVRYIITYADETAIQFFKKQHFTRPTKLKAWKGRIKDYTNARLMMFDLKCDNALAKNLPIQTKYAKQVINKHVDIYCQTITPKSRKRKRLLLQDIPTLNISVYLESIMQKLLREFKRLDCIDAFLSPVTEREAPGYRYIIKHPMCVELIEEKLDNQMYVTLEEFKADWKLIVENCKKFNDPDTTYHQDACTLDEKLDRAFAQYMFCTKKNKKNNLP